MTQELFHKTLFSRMFWNKSGHFQRKGVLNMFSSGLYTEHFYFPVSGIKQESFFQCKYERLGRFEDNFYNIHSTINIGDYWLEAITIKNKDNIFPYHNIKYFIRLSNDKSEYNWNKIDIDNIPCQVWKLAELKSDKDIIKTNY